MRLWRERLIGFEAMAIAPDPDSCVLFVAAEAREFSGLLRFCHAPQKLAWPVRWGRSASLNGCEILMLANGAGRAQAAAALEIARRMRKLTAVVSTGFCGALDPELAIGDIFVATRIESSEGCFGAALPLAAARHASGVLLSIDHVAQTADEKRVLHSAGAAAVEMEAAGLAALAAGSRLPLFCVRAVTDTASESFANNFNAALLPDGRFDSKRLLRAAMRRPQILLPELIRLRHRCEIAARALGDFLADCRF